MTYNQKKMSKKRLTALILSLFMVFLFLFQVESKPVSAEEPFTPSPAPLIIEQFTGGWCGYCPLAAAYLQIAKLTMFPNNEFAVTAYHNGDPMANSDSEQRENFYNVDAFPTLVFGGSTIVRGSWFAGLRRRLG